jgi:DeoR family transcriptional regulator, catabolite repression regulator
MKSTTLVSTVSLEAGILPRRTVADGQSLSLNDPALLAITDFTREYPVTVAADRQIDDALGDMVSLGVRALLVRRDQRIVGLVTSYDIQGERPIQFLQSSNYRHHHEIRVADIMTPWDALKAIHWGTLQAMRAGDLLHLLEEANLTHALVVEIHRGAPCVVRALVSRARLIRQLTNVEPTERRNPLESRHLN